MGEYKNISVHTKSLSKHQHQTLTQLQNTDLCEGLIVEHFISIDLFIVTDSVSIVNVQPYLVTI